MLVTEAGYVDGGFCARALHLCFKVGVEAATKLHSLRHVVR